MRGTPEYLDIFDECQENKKLVALHNQVIEEGNSLVSKMREYEAKITQDAARIKNLEAEVAKSKSGKPVVVAKTEIKPSGDSTKKLSSVESELKSIGRELKDLLSQDVVRSSQPSTPVERNAPPPAPVTPRPLPPPLEKAPSDNKDAALLVSSAIPNNEL